MGLCISADIFQERMGELFAGMEFARIGEGRGYGGR